MPHRLYLPEDPVTGTRIDLDRERAHYLTRVLRLRRDEALIVFDGAGRAWSATLADAGARSATLAIGALQADEPPPAPAIHLVQALLKGGAMDTVIQKAVELGATDLWLLQAERSNVPGGERAERKRAHWQRVIESAAEQCGALHLTRLHPACGLDELLARPPAPNMLLLDPGAPLLPVDLPRADVALLVGPEGGWSDAERAACEAAGVRPVGLGTRVLRAETAPLAALAALRHGWGWG
ncbi:MAG: 16S rRNA (uracil(1498)-N(3))-methyltransferase [Pseudomonadales bacterium]